MYNNELVKLMKQSVSNGQHAINANEEDIKNLNKMVNDGYLAKFDIIDNEMFGNQEREVVFYPTEKFRDL